MELTADMQPQHRQLDLIVQL